MRLLGVLCGTYGHSLACWFPTSIAYLLPLSLDLDVKPGNLQHANNETAHANPFQNIQNYSVGCVRKPAPFPHFTFWVADLAHVNKQYCQWHGHAEYSSYGNE